jgi:hypothetical protein
VLISRNKNREQEKTARFTGKMAVNLAVFLYFLLFSIGFENRRECNISTIILQRQNFYSEIEIQT